MRLLAAVTLLLALAPARARADEVDEFLSELDGRYYTPAHHGAQSLTCRADVLGLKESGVDGAKITFYWQAPDKKAARIEGGPKEWQEHRKEMEAEATEGVDLVVPPSWSQWASSYDVKMSEDGEKTKLEATPKADSQDAKNGVKGWTLWFDGDLKLVMRVKQMEGASTRYEETWKETDAKEYYLDTVRETLLDGDGKGTFSHQRSYAWQKQGDLLLLVNEKDGAGIKDHKDETNYVDYAINPEIDAAIFGGK